MVNPITRRIGCGIVPAQSKKIYLQGGFAALIKVNGSLTTPPARQNLLPDQF